MCVVRRWVSTAGYRGQGRQGYRPRNWRREQWQRRAWRDKDVASYTTWPFRCEDDKVGVADG